MPSLPIFETDRALTPAERKKLFGGTVPAKRRGHAAQPGSGPAGKTCQHCKHLRWTATATRHFKCDLMRAHWTGGYATDIKARDAACSKWEAK